MPACRQASKPKYFPYASLNSRSARRCPSRVSSFKFQYTYQGDRGLKALQEDAKRRGLDKMNMDEIDAEIAATVASSAPDRSPADCVVPDSPFTIAAACLYPKRTLIVSASSRRCRWMTTRRSS